MVRNLVANKKQETNLASSFHKEIVLTLAGWLGGWLARFMADWPFDRWMACWMIDWQVGWLSVWLGAELDRVVIY